MQFSLPVPLVLVLILVHSFLFHLRRSTLAPQTQIENKIKTIENVIDMLSGIIEKDKSNASTPERAKESDDSSPERLKTKVIESLIQRQNPE